MQRNRIFLSKFDCHCPYWPRWPSKAYVIRRCWANGYYDLTCHPREYRQLSIPNYIGGVAVRFQFVLCCRVAWNDMALCKFLRISLTFFLNQVNSLLKLWAWKSELLQTPLALRLTGFSISSWWWSPVHRSTTSTGVHILVRFILSLVTWHSDSDNLVFACLNAFIIPIVYFFFPETAGRSLEGASISILTLGLVTLTLISSSYQTWMSSSRLLTTKACRQSRYPFARMYLSLAHPKPMKFLG